MQQAVTPTCKSCTEHTATEAKTGGCCGNDADPLKDAIAILGADPENHKAKWEVKPAKTGHALVKLNTCQSACQTESVEDDKGGVKATKCDCEDDPNPAKDALEILGADPENAKAKWQVKPANSNLKTVSLTGAQTDAESWYDSIDALPQEDFGLW